MIHNARECKAKHHQSCPCPRPFYCLRHFFCTCPLPRSPLAFPERRNSPLSSLLVRPHHCHTVCSCLSKSALRKYCLRMGSVFKNCEKLTNSMFLCGVRWFWKASKIVALLAKFHEAKDRWLSKPNSSRGWVPCNCCKLHDWSPTGLSSVFNFTSLGNSPRMADLPALLMNFNIATKGASGKPKNKKIMFLVKCVKVPALLMNSASRCENTWAESEED